MSSPKPGHRRSWAHGSSIVGMTVPSYPVWTRWYDHEPREDYLSAVIRIEGQVGDLVSEIEKSAEAIPILVPLASASQCDRWAKENGLDFGESAVRARYAAEYAHGAAETDSDGATIISGLHTYSSPGDIIAVAIAMESGWDGVSPAPIYGELADSLISVGGEGNRARISAHTHVRGHYLVFSCDIAGTNDEMLIAGDRADLDVMTMLHIWNNVAGGDGFMVITTDDEEIVLGNGPCVGVHTDLFSNGGTGLQECSV